MEEWSSSIHIGSYQAAYNQDMPDKWDERGEAYGNHMGIVFHNYHNFHHNYQTLPNELVYAYRAQWLDLR
jgi:hypothetical protein